jgi:heme exporter protein D
MQAAIDYLKMGGYAAFVWPAYGLTAIVLVGLVVQSLGRYRRSQRELEQLQRARPPRPGRRIA